MLCAVTDYSTMEFVKYEDVFNYLQGGAGASEGAKRSIRRKSTLGGSQKSLHS